MKSEENRKDLDRKFFFFLIFSKQFFRSAGKVPNSKQRSSTRSTRSLGRTGGSRALNPVTRLMERDDRTRNPIIDSSTSNDGTERYGVLKQQQQPVMLHSVVPQLSVIIPNQEMLWCYPL